jgi:hypothetical protein
VEKAVKKLKIKTDVIEVGPAINFEISSKEAAFPKIDIHLVFYIQQENWPASATTNISPQLKAIGVGLVPKVLEAPDDTRLWQISFSAIEIKLFKDIDADGGGIRKKLQKIMKYLKLATEWPKTL